jgi:hypothetical protein
MWRYLAEVYLQALIDETESGIIMSKNAIDFIMNDISKSFIIISQWVCDGSTGHSEYKQRSLEDASESDIFITSLVTFHLYATKTSGDKCIL